MTKLLIIPIIGKNELLGLITVDGDLTDEEMDAILEEMEGMEELLH